MMTFKAKLYWWNFDLFQQMIPRLSFSFDKLSFVIQLDNVTLVTFKSAKFATTILSLKQIRKKKHYAIHS